MPVMQKTLADHFFEKVAIAGKDECWLWTGNRRGRPSYGSFAIEGKWMNAHRAAWIIKHGSIPTGLYVCHRCDVPLCVNVAHLFLGTAADNNRDRAQKGRSNPMRGAQHRLAKLNDESARKIIAAKGTHSSIAAEFGVSKTVVGNIKRRRIWTHLGGSPPVAYKQIGERAGHAKLTAKQVLEIRERYANGETNKAKLGREFGTSDAAIFYIIARRSWTHI